MAAQHMASSHMAASSLSAAPLGSSSFRGSPALLAGSRRCAVRQHRAELQVWRVKIPDLASEAPGREIPGQHVMASRRGDAMPQ